MALWENGWGKALLSTDAGGTKIAPQATNLLLVKGKLGVGLPPGDSPIITPASIAYLRKQFAAEQPFCPADVVARPLVQGK